MLSSHESLRFQEPRTESAGKLINGVFPDPTTFKMEPDDGIPSSWYESEIEAENGRTKLEKEFAFGELKLQRRSRQSQNNSGSFKLYPVLK